MTTKSDGISSGLVAFCYMSEQFEFALFSDPPTDPLYADMFPVVRLSDAEAIISQQAERIKELEAALKYARMDADVWMRDAEGKLADRTEAYQTTSKQSAALKLAREALASSLTSCISFSTLRKASEALAAIEALGE